jgi:excinuclease ABC subunit A
VIVIEHNLDVIKTSDWVVDLGPEGGPDGGHVVATGPPETIARTRGSHTGHHLKPLLARSRAKTRKKAARKTASTSRS